MADGHPWASKLAGLEQQVNLEAPFPAMSPAGKEELTEEEQDKQNGLKQAGADALEDGKHDLALESFSEAIAIGCASALLYSRRAQLLVQLGRPRAAANDCSAALVINPDSAKAMKIRARAYAKVGMLEEAHVDFQTALKIDYDEQTYDDSLEVAAKVKETQANNVAKRVKDEAEEYERKLKESKKAYEEGMKANEEKFREQRIKEELEKQKKEADRRGRVRKREADPDDEFDRPKSFGPPEPSAAEAVD